MYLRSTHKLFSPYCINEFCRNNYYFEEDKALSFGGKEFDEESKKYLADAYNYTFEAVMKDTGLTKEDLDALREDNMHYKIFVDLIMEELSFNKSNYFNIILSGGRTPQP